MERIDILRHTIEALERMNAPHMVVGSFASIASGEARFTQDIDIVVDFQPTDVEASLAAFPPEAFYRSESAIREAIQTTSQFYVIHPSSGNRIDFILRSGDEWALVRMARRRPVRLLPDREEVEPWAGKLGYQETRRDIAAKADGTDAPSGPATY